MDLLGQDPFALDGLEVERLLGCWQYPQLGYIDCGPDQFDLLTAFYLQLGEPPVDTEGGRVVFREAWMKFLLERDGVDEAGEGTDEDESRDLHLWVHEKQEAEVEAHEDPQEDWEFRDEYLDFDKIRTGDGRPKS